MTRARTLLDQLKTAPSTALMDQIEALLTPREWPQPSLAPTGHTRTTVLNAGRYRADGGALYGMLPKTIWQNWAPPDRQNRLPLHNNLLFIEQGERRILVDCGMGRSTEAQEAYKATSTAAATFQPVDTAPRQVTDVILTHLHFAHAGGAVAMDREGQVRPLFRNAAYHAHRRAFEDWERNRGSPLFGPRPDDLGALRPQLELFTGEQELAPGVLALEAEGHSPGNLAVVVQLGAERTVFLGCTAPTALHLQHNLTSAWDADRDLVLADRARLVREGFQLIFGHGRPATAYSNGQNHTLGPAQ